MALKVGELFATLNLQDKGFIKDLTSAQNQADTLKKAMADCMGSIGKFENSLSGAKNALAEARTAQTANNAALEAAQKKHAELEEQVRSLQTALTGASGSIKNELTEQLKNAKTALKDSSQEMKVLKSACANSDAAVKKFSSQVKQAQTSLNNAKKSLGGLKISLNDLQPILTSNVAKLQQYSFKLDEVSKKAKNAANWQNKAGKALTLSVTTPIVTGLGFSAKEVIDFEDAFAGVEKTVDASEAQLADLKQAYIDLSEEIPVTKEAFAGIGEIAGQLNIKYEALEGFTKIIADLSATTKLTAEDGAEALAKFANITGMEQTAHNFESIASAIVDLGNNSATSEVDIMAMALRLAGAGRAAGMSEADILGISTALSSLGIEAEMGGSAFSRLISMLQVAVETGSDDLKNFAEIAGMTGDQFAAAFQENAAQALASFIVGLGSGTQSATVLMQDLGITELRLSDALRRTTNANSLFSASIQRANTAWKENTAMTKEAEKRYKTFASRLNITKNKFGNAAMTLGEQLMPTLESAMDKVSGLIDGFAGLDESTKASIVNWGMMAAAVGPSLKILGKANDAIGLVTTGLSGLVKSAAAAGGGFAGAGSALLSALKSAIGPAGLVISLGVAAYGVYKLANGENAIEELQKDFDSYLDEKSTLTAEQIASVTVLPEYKLSEETTAAINGVYQNIADALTDGAPDTEKVVNGLETDVTGLFATTRENIETWYNNEMKNLDLNTESGLEAAMKLGEERDKLLEETASAESGTFQFIGTYAGASTDLVKQHVNELDTLVNKITQINADIESQRQLAESVQKASFDLVIKGQASDDQSIANAINYAYQSWHMDSTKIESYTQTQMEEAAKAFQAGGETLAEFLSNFDFAGQLGPDAVFSDWYELFSADQSAQMQEAKRAYIESIKSILGGIASTMGAEGEQLMLDFSNLGITTDATESIQSIMDTLAETPLPEMSPEQRSALAVQAQSILEQYAQVVGEEFSGGESLGEYITDTDQTYMVVEIMDQLAREFESEKKSMAGRISEIFGEDTQLSDALSLALQSNILDDLEIDTSGIVEALGDIFDPTLLNTIGDDAGGEIGHGMATHDYSSDAETSISNLENDLSSAAQQGSPAKRFYPLGRDIAAGIAEGMKQFVFGPACGVVVNSIKSTLSAQKNSFHATGYQFAAGLASGIRAGKSIITSAAREAARAAVTAANKELSVQSPSRVMMETGRYFDLGFAQGITQNLRYATGAASELAKQAAGMVAMRNPGAGARRMVSVGASASSPAPIDYDQMAKAMSRVKIAMILNGKQIAEEQADNNASASIARSRRFAIGVGH